ncbi:MAG: hypothetical protein GOVbin1782_65 [Prokaryotic dsDNA virus sp.]|nr:MAG: hypothetical protein GOVbin1782_65 [Prokaryotic dsDNA virus sp.]|tara:strand:+ start:2452 stop:2751 length:300 start_codon:yes stop_codon:yes gene_type:complete
MSWQDILKYYDYEEHFEEKDIIRIQEHNTYLEYYVRQPYEHGFAYLSRDYNNDNQELVSGEIPMPEKLKKWFDGLKDPSEMSMDEMERAEKMGLEVSRL